MMVSYFINVYVCCVGVVEFDDGWLWYVINVCYCIYCINLLWGIGSCFGLIDVDVVFMCDKMCFEDGFIMLSDFFDLLML